jgi:hypothetical protein
VPYLSSGYFRFNKLGVRSLWCRVVVCPAHIHIQKRPNNKKRIQ